MAQIMTSAAANKLLKSYNDRVDNLYMIESQRRSYTRVDGVVPIKPEYDFDAVRTEIDSLNGKIIEIKHAINMFNVNTVLPEACITIDRALIKMAQLNKLKTTLNLMRMQEPEKLKESFGQRASNTAEYTVANYNPKDAQKVYEDVCNELSALQLELDFVNSTEKITINID